MRTIVLIILFGISISVSAQETFDKYFTDKVLRFDFMLDGNSQKTSVYPGELKEEQFWAVEAISQESGTDIPGEGI